MDPIIGPKTNPKLKTAPNIPKYLVTDTFFKDEMSTSMEWQTTVVTSNAPDINFDKMIADTEGYNAINKNSKKTPRKHVIRIGLRPIRSLNNPRY
jgi:hypothetical protein